MAQIVHISLNCAWESILVGGFTWWKLTNKEKFRSFTRFASFISFSYHCRSTRTYLYVFIQISTCFWHLGHHVSRRGIILQECNWPFQQILSALVQISTRFRHLGHQVSRTCYNCAIGHFNKLSAATFCLPWVVFLASPRHRFSFWWDHHLEIGRRAHIVSLHFYISPPPLALLQPIFTLWWRLLFNISRNFMLI